MKMDTVWFLVNIQEILNLPIGSVNNEDNIIVLYYPQNAFKDYKPLDLYGR
eukprot:CAMPEP_0197839586 /NCGR_PEP_ID=MMETSP1437-20131217/43594_1 /TAXON_ID=49252 ORGANISM="Eucampia antarctica, Strain CCMP1452" /NCGR_SAMPLE_ID=MMETSP1437 /ASSEMBLY_ACC=CAM_ASM_001096 /LENGTH=50 /DNA_ID=CAMNT_0043448787 /DNA_START=112 /DNA_END=260 /DNA_ORIENTATION=+